MLNASWSSPFSEVLLGVRGGGHMGLPRVCPCGLVCPGQGLGSSCWHCREEPAGLDPRGLWCGCVAACLMSVRGHSCTCVTGLKSASGRSEAGVCE